MGRRKKGNAVHGWVVIDKPQGVTSTQVVGIVKRVFNAQKAGHAGTLDPMATGVLAVALGEATKTVPYAMDAEKSYLFTAKWGEATDSDDADGTVTATTASRPSRAEILAALPALTGTILQTPPAYSAIKVDGMRAYDLAREGETVSLAARPVAIHEVHLCEQPAEDLAVFEMRCGKGAYVRAFVRDLAQALGTLGHVCALRRTSVGSFTVQAAISLENLKEFMHSPAAFEHLRPLSTALDGIPALAVTGPDVVRLKSGNPILCRAGQFAKLAEQGGDELQGQTVFLSTPAGEPIALAELVEGQLQPFRVFNFTP